MAISLFLFVSCNEIEEVPTIIEHKTLGESSHQNVNDSLDTGSSPYVTSNFPDSVRHVLYQAKDTIWQVVYNSLLPNPLKAAFPNQLFIETLQKEEFQIDTTDGKLFAKKRLFNQRHNIQFNWHQPDTIIVVNEQWFEGSRYLLVTAMPANAYRRAESYR
jgi:hypothetical protein